MIKDQIEQDVLIEAPVDIVWRIVTEPDHIAQWFSDAAELDPQPGGVGVLKFGDLTGPDAKVQPFFVEAYEPTSRFSFRWCHENSDDRNTKSLLVEFTLTPEGENNTRLHMIESGFEERADAAMYEDHTNGWSAIIPRLVDHAKQQV